MTRSPDRHRTSLAFEYPAERRARIVARAVEREVGEIDDDRSATRLDRDGRTVSIEIGAADLVALRAAHNTWMALVRVAERTADLGSRVAK